MGAEADALAERMVGSVIATAEVVTVYLGDRLGLYAPLAEDWMTPAELADATGIAERYAREWLEQQAVAGFLEVDGRVPTSAGTGCRPSTPRCWSTGTRPPTWPRSAGCSSRRRNSSLP